MFARTVAARAGFAANATSRRSLGMTQQVRTMSGQISKEASSIQELPSDEAHDVAFESKYGLRSIILNRPKKLNSLNASMIRKIVPRMLEWEKSDMTNVVVLKGSGEKALCAGGDVTTLAQMNKEVEDGWKKSADFFALEYKLDHYIATYKKPYVAFMDGITMGGGVGLSIHAPFRIATERTVFAMPETTIGFFPDVGASFFLPKMNGAVGTYLALTSERLTGPNVFYSGVATHYLHSTTLPDVEARLSEMRFEDRDDYATRLKLINDTLEEFVTGLPYDEPMHLSGETRNAIDRCFSKNSIDEILEALSQETGATEEWAQKQLKTLQKRSPTSIRVTLQQMRDAQKWNIAETFKREHQIATKFMKHPDFTEGVTALLVRKEAAKWSTDEPDVGELLSYDEESAIKLFDGERSYTSYPHDWIGVPSETEVAQFVKDNSDLKLSALKRKIVGSRKNRQGMSEVVDEILQRKTVRKEDGTVEWVFDPVPSKL